MGVDVEETTEDFSININVERKNGSTGEVSVKYRAEDDSAIHGKDFELAEGVLTFQPGELNKTIAVVIKARGRYERVEKFRVLLEEPTGGVKFDPATDGGVDQCIMYIQIKANME